jgi:hypothetical protein
MNDVGYIAAGYVVTAATVVAYAWSIRTRSRRVLRTFGSATPLTSPGSTVSSGTSDDEG